MASKIDLCTLCLMRCMNNSCVIQYTQCLSALAMTLSADLITDTVLKEHVASLQDKQQRAHRRASRPSVTSARSRHKRQQFPTKPSSLYVSSTPTYGYEPEMNRRSRDVSPIGVAGALESRPSSTSALLDKSGGEGGGGGGGV